MSDYFPEMPLELAWRILNRVSPDATPMTRTETIMRREEAMKMRWPLFLVDAEPMTEHEIGTRIGEALVLHDPALRALYLGFCHE